MSMPIADCDASASQRAYPRPSRRAALKLGLTMVAMASGILRPRLALGGEGGLSSARRSKPRHVVQILLRGGIDAVWTTDPKRASEVARGVDVPYESKAIVEAGGVRLGPHLAPLAASASDMAIVNGVQVHTANHETGVLQVQRLRTGVTQGMPPLLDIVARHRDGQPLGTVTLGDYGPAELGPGYFGQPYGEPGREFDPTGQVNPGLLTQLEMTDPADLQVMAGALRENARRLAGRAAKEGKLATTAANAEAAAALFERLPKVTPFRPQVWSQEPRTQRHAVNLQRALWLIENDLTKSVYIRATENWDTHVLNKEQEAASGRFIPMLARFLDEAKRRVTPHGSVLDTTLVVVGSELGRFPRLNGDRGKDHLPQAPVMFFGRAINTNGSHGAVYGATGREMEALPIRVKDGRPQGVGGVSVELDDIGATLLHLVGIDPRAYGYDGRVLEFLVG